MANYADSTRTPRTLTEREQRLLLKVTGAHRSGFRDHMLYAMALGTGLREHELIAVRLDVFAACCCVWKHSGVTVAFATALTTESTRLYRRLWRVQPP